jgi:hypothetical protein
MDETLYIYYCGVLPTIYLNRIKNTSKDIAIVGKNTTNTINIRFNNYSFISTVFPKIIISQLVDHLLGDGSMVYTKTSVNPKFVFTQTFKRFQYT